MWFVILTMRMNGEWTNGVCGDTGYKRGEPTLKPVQGDTAVYVHSTIPYPYTNLSQVLFRLFGYDKANNKFKRVNNAYFTRDKAYLKLPANMFHWTNEYDSNDNGGSSGVTDPSTGGQAQSSNVISLVFGEDDESEATGIQQIDQTLRQIDSDSYYTLQGAKLNGRPTQRGIYIHNGKKVIVK